MTYDPNVPNESNLVRTLSGDLVAMQGNFEELAPIVSAHEIEGTAPSAGLKGWYFGDDTNRKRYYVRNGASDNFRLQRNINTEASPSWESVISFGQGTGTDITVGAKVVGVTPTASSHLATKGYVDSATLSGLTDTEVSGVTSGEYLRYNGSEWGYGVPELNDLTDVSLPSPASGEVLRYTGAQWEAGHEALSGLTDTAVSGATSGQVLTYDGSNWIADDASGGSATLSGLTDTAVSGATSGHALEYNGSQWVPTSDPVILNDGSRYFTGEYGVGIGDAADAGWALDIRGSNTKLSNEADAVLTLKLDSGSSTGQISVLAFADRGVNKWEFTKTADNNWWVYDTANSCHPFKIFASVGGVDTLVLSGGSVGIGAVPDTTYKLDINGDVRIAGDLILSGSVAVSISGLSDTSVSGATSGQVLMYDGSDWIAEDFSAGTLSGLTDTAVSGATSGQVMEFDGVYWRNVDFSAGTLSGLTDTAVSGATSGQVLTSNGAGSWVPGDVSATLSGLTDTAVSGATSGQILTYDGSNWIADDASGGSATLSGLTDTAVSGATSGQMLAYDGSDWRHASYLVVSGIIGRKLVSGIDTVGLWLFDGDLTDEIASTDLNQSSAFSLAPTGNGLRGVWVSDSIVYAAAVVSGLQYTGDMTLEVIFKVHQLPDTAACMGVLARCGTTGEDEADNILYSIGVSTDGQLIYQSEHGAGINDVCYFGSYNVVVPGTTHHLAMIRSSNNVSMYLDGCQIGAASGITAPTGGGNSYIEVGGYSLGACNWLGAVACCKLVSGAMSEADVLDEFESTFPRAVPVF